MDSLQLLSTYPIWSVILIGAAVIIIILKCIDWGKKTWKKRQDFKQAAILEGEEIQKQEDATTHEKEALEKRVKELEEGYKKVIELLQKQDAVLDLLQESDELEIKTWIKAQHDKWVPTGCIDSQALDLVCQRYAVYKQEGGNSWAEKMVEDIKNLTIVTNIPLK